MKGVGRVIFAATMLIIIGMINILYGIGAVSDASIFVNDTRFIFSNLHTMGWLLIILGIVEIAAGYSLMGGRTFGRMMGIIVASLGAIAALLSIGGAYPWWSLAVFALNIYVLHGIIVFGGDEESRAALR